MALALAPVAYTIMNQVCFFCRTTSSSPFRQPNILLLSCVIGSHMTIYVMLGNLKSSAFEKFDSIEERDQKAKKIIESLGGNMLSLFYTFGQYDFVAIIDMPTKESLVKFLAIVAKFGMVRTETLETISPDTFYKISQEI